ncbi:hypothetical protein [Cupriavidus basilensis]
MTPGTPSIPLSQPFSAGRRLTIARMPNGFDAVDYAQVLKE